MIGYFYDIESLSNVFTLVNFRDDENACDIYYLIDNDKEILGNLTKSEILDAMKKRIYERNSNFKGECFIYDLKEEAPNIKLAETFGLSDAAYINDKNNRSNYSDAFRLRCDTDTDYDENKDYYLFGYNSYHYDTTMLTMYMYDVIPTLDAVESPTRKFSPTTAKLMRQYNDELFSDQFDGPSQNMEDRLRYAYKNAAYPSRGYSAMNYKDPKAVIRKNMLMSGRHIDVARLNEKQQKVGLKRLLGMLGYQILESNKLKPGQNTIENFDQFLDLTAYNVSDCVNLKMLFNHKDYSSAFTLKKQLLHDYPDLVYEQCKDKYAPNISPETVRKDRLFIDSSSAQLSTKALCPYDHLKDYDTVSFMYPSEQKAKDLGIPRVNVLEESKNFFYKNFHQPELRARFDEIYNYYKSIEGKNFNSSKNYLIDHGIDVYDSSDELPERLKPYNLSAIPTPNTCMFYYNKDGSPSSCFVNFSTGGIHGAEYNVKLFAYDMKIYQDKLDKWQEEIDLINRVHDMFDNNPCELKKQKGVTIDGKKYTPSKFLMPKATETEAYWKANPKPPKKPEVFIKSPSGSWNIAKRYTYTSADMTNHEDFTSYYPNMLRMMDAFFNTGLGYDRYGEIFDNKTKFGILMKDKSLSAEERERYSVMRNGTKLILNSASGAADANFESNIRMNNKIISMRIIGQLFTWRIGQAQTIEGAKMTSTNTDGLYSVLEPTLNDKILARESESIHVEIEPEPIYLISKDSNNRMEIELENNSLGEITGASGGTLSCRRGPNPSKNLAHSAIIDWALAEYLCLAASKYKNTSMTSPFDDNTGKLILSNARKKFNNDIHTLLMFQNVIASSPGSQRFIFATHDDDLDEPIPLQHYNRCFIVKDKTAGAYHLQAASAKVITDAMAKKRESMSAPVQNNDPMASAILTVNGVKVTSLPINKEATVTKITGVEESWYMYICNENLHDMSQEKINYILDNLDYDKYLTLLKDSFENNWRNMTPDDIIAAELEKKNTKTQTPVTLLD